jgi:hypothetical protein
MESDACGRNETTRTHERQLQFLVYHLEAASLMADQAGVGKMMWLVDFVGYNFSTAPPARISIQTVHILQVSFNCHPFSGQRLHACVSNLLTGVVSWKLGRSAKPEARLLLCLCRIITRSVWASVSVTFPPEYSATRGR